MTEPELKALVAGLVPVVKELLEQRDRRIAALETEVKALRDDIAPIRQALYAKALNDPAWPRGYVDTGPGRHEKEPM
jgi:hypothetical protein